MKYAIVESGGKQYKVVEGGFIEVDRLPDEIGKNIKFEQVLFLADGENFTVGTPVIKDTPVWTTIVEHFRGEKVITFNYRPKKRIRVKSGHRQNYTRLLVEQIGGGALVKKEPVKKVEPKKEEKPEAELKAAKKPAKDEAAETRKPARTAPKKETAKAAPVKETTKPEPKKTTPKTAPAKKAPAKKPAKPAAK
jgi:large subunit ribosomal protein L21